MQQFSIALDDEILEGLREMARIARRQYREQAALLVDRAVQDWQRSGRLPTAAMLDPTDQRETVAA